MRGVLEIEYDDHIYEVQAETYDDRDIELETPLKKCIL